MFSIYLHIVVLIAVVTASHYKGGVLTYTIRSNPGNGTSDNELIQVRIEQRHSWIRSTYFCNNTSPSSGDIIGSGALQIYGYRNSSISKIPSIDARVRCTDYSEEFNYSTGENSTNIDLPINNRIEYVYSSCCWITLLPPDSGSNWSLKLVINTKQRLDGT
ncbi:unnamed protein product [Rotaria sp. Silwood2]|nr:unnamed protein product [Rotaria sp. Silwood2]CAF4695340.1 unnamed protein product [Rotaria sp. Silwood2]